MLELRLAPHFYPATVSGPGGSACPLPFGMPKAEQGGSPVDWDDIPMREIVDWTWNILKQDIVDRL